MHSFELQAAQAFMFRAVLRQALQHLSSRYNALTTHCQSIHLPYDGDSVLESQKSMGPVMDFEILSHNVWSCMKCIRIRENSKAIFPLYLLAMIASEIGNGRHLSRNPNALWRSEQSFYLEPMHQLQILVPHFLFQLMDDEIDMSMPYYYTQALTWSPRCD